MSDEIKTIRTYEELSDIAERLTEQHSRLEELARALMVASELEDFDGVSAILSEYRAALKVQPFRVDGNALQEDGGFVSDGVEDDSGNDSGEGWLN